MAVATTKEGYNRGVLLELTRACPASVGSGHGKTEAEEVTGGAAEEEIGTGDAVEEEAVFKLYMASAAGTRLADPVTLHCSTRTGKPAFTRGWLTEEHSSYMHERTSVVLSPAIFVSSFCPVSAVEKNYLYLARIAMEIFTKKLTSIDIERGLVLPPDSNLEPLPPFHGARTIELSTIVVKSAAGITTLPGGEPVTIHCSTRSGRLTLTRGWYDIARDVGLGSGDIVTFYEEVNGGTLFKMRVRNVG
ncbi:hypothetical protein Peur_021254 [Populus x canadensis]